MEGCVRPDGEGVTPEFLKIYEKMFFVKHFSWYEYCFMYGYVHLYHMDIFVIIYFWSFCMSEYPKSLSDSWTDWVFDAHALTFIIIPCGSSELSWFCWHKHIPSCCHSDHHSIPLWNHCCEFPEHCSLSGGHGASEHYLNLSPFLFRVRSLPLPNPSTRDTPSPFIPPSSFLSCCAGSITCWRCRLPWTEHSEVIAYNRYFQNRHVTLIWSDWC